jgi:flagellar M-ring protein FliF
MNFFQKLNAIWRNVSVVQRAVLVAIVLTLIIVGGLLTHWARRPDLALLYSNLDPEEAGKITEKISDKGIVYKLTKGGTTIYAPKKDIAQLRLDMAKEGLPEGSQKGYGIFDDEKIGISPFVQNINLKRALQDELAKSIQMIDGVTHARVHIVSTEQKVFTPETSETRASVVLRIKPGYQLSSSNVAAITHLVSGSVEGLKSENVTVVDSQGRLLSSESDQVLGGGAGTVADYRERVEQNLSSKAEDMLTAVLGPGRAKVRVSAEIDMSSINTLTETPIKGVAKKEEIKEKSSTKGGATPAEGEQAASGSKEKDSTTVTEFQPGKTVKQEVILPGKIQYLTVAAVVDLSAADVNEAQGGGEAAKIMEVAEVEELIVNALGLNLDKGDSLKVVEAKFHRPAGPLLGEADSGGLDFVAIAGQASLGIMAICALFVLKMFSGARKKAASAAATQQLPMGEGAGAAFLPAGAEASESLVLRRQIANSLRSNPEQAKRLFTSWLEEKGGQ